MIFSKLFKKRPKPVKQINVQKATVILIINQSNDTNHKIHLIKFAGQMKQKIYIGDLPNFYNYPIYAKEKFENWLKNCERMGFFQLDNNTYIPFKNIIKININYEDYFLNDEYPFNEIKTQKETISEI